MINKTKNLLSVSITMFMILSICIAGVSTNAYAKTLTIKSIKNITASANQNATYTLPKTVPAVMSDNSQKNVAVTWSPNKANTAKVGTFTFKGKVKGYSKAFTLTLTVKAAVSFDFRNTYFGMTKDQVLKSEKNKPSYNQGNILGYENNFEGFDTSIWYVFNDDGQLYKAGLSFDNEYEDLNAYIDDYYSVKESYIKLFGDITNPDSEVEWLDDTYADDEASYGLAISQGQLELYSAWETEKADIELLLTGEDDEISHTLFFYSTKIQGPEETEDEE